MMLLIFSDIHGSVENITNFIEKNSTCPFSKYLFAGDFFGYFIGSNTISKFINSILLEYILGNHDLYYLRELYSHEFNNYYNIYNELLLDQDIYNEKYGALKETCDQIDKELFLHLCGSPLYKKFLIDELTCILCHGSPDDPWGDYIYPDSNKIDYFFEAYDFDLLILGHTHIPFVINKNDRYIINPGSRTLPRGDNKCPSVIIGDTQNMTFTIQYIDQYVNYTRLTKNKVLII